MARSLTLTNAEARRLALAAQGFGARSTTPLASTRDIRRAVEQLGVVQIDSVNVLVRSHYLPLFSRYGGYACDLLEQAAYSGNKRALFEYWGHEASLLPIHLYPLFRWRMQQAQEGKGVWSGIARFGREQPDFIAAVLEQIRARGPLGVSELEQAGKRSGAWWGWSDGKRALEWLFWTGAITTVSRKKFERIYDLAERAIPKKWFTQPAPTQAEAQRALLEIAARALGVATASDLKDYFRLDNSAAKARILELIEAGTLRPVAVEGWKAPGYLHHKARIPETMEVSALLSPFDSLVWERARTERLFNFHYRLEIYTPQHKRKHGYYVLPFLFGDELVARVDLKADRAERTLRVLAAHAEHALPVEAACMALANKLRSLALWLGLEHIKIGQRGKLTTALRAQFRKTA